MSTAQWSLSKKSVALWSRKSEEMGSRGSKLTLGMSSLERTANTVVRKSLSVLLLLVLLLAGAVQPVEAFRVFGENQEIQIGADVAAEVEAEHGVWRDRYWNQRIQDIGASLVPYSQRPDLPYQFRILDTEQVNAIAIPGGFVYVYRGLLDVVQDEDQLAAVIAHEIAHVANRHSMRRLERNLGIQLGVSFVFRLLLRNDSNAGGWQQITNVGVHLLNQGYSREDEFDADLTGVQMMAAASYDPMGMVGFFETLQTMHQREPSKLEVFFSTHPPHRDRIVRVEDWIAANHY